MSGSVTTRAIQSTSKATARGLTQLGFRRQGNHLHRAVGDLVHVIHFQASQWGSRTSGSFTVNLAVTAPAVYSAWTGRAFPSNPGSALFPISMRIGGLMPARRDHWWAVDEATDLHAVETEVASVIMEHAARFFDAYPSIEAILVHLRTGGSLPGLFQAQLPVVHALFALQAGARDEARELLIRADAEALGSSFQDTVRVVASRAGVSLS